MIGLSALNFTLPVRAEIHGHAFSIYNINQIIYSINQIIYSINQITLGEHQHAKYCGSAPQPARRQQGQLIWKKRCKIKLRGKINNKYYGLALSPARLEQAQLIIVWKRASSSAKQSKRQD